MLEPITLTEAVENAIRFLKEEHPRRAPAEVADEYRRAAATRGHRKAEAFWALVAECCRLGLGLAARLEVGIPKAPGGTPAWLSPGAGDAYYAEAA